MVTKEHIEDAEAQLEAARATVVKLRDEYERESIVPLMRKQIGKCFRYLNGYGDRERWWVFVRIIGVDEIMADYKAFSIQKDSRGIVRADLSEMPAREGVIMDSYQPISRSKFDRAIKPLLTALNEAAKH